jgi:hypothetical protein
LTLTDDADVRLAAGPLGHIENGNGIVEGRDAANVRAQSSVAYSPDDFTRLATIGHENKIYRLAIRGPSLDWPVNRDQCSAGPDQACRRCPDIAADDVESMSTSLRFSRGVVSRSINS